jgi:hypothetical protein
MHINDLRKTLASIDGRLRELAPTKPAWDRLIERCDDLRCGDCNQHVASDSRRRHSLRRRSAWKICSIWCR